MARLTASAATFTLVPTKHLTPHEHVDEAHVDELAERIRAEGALFKPVVADAGSRVVLDGHHRFAALQQLGCQLIPCHLIDYLDPAIRVEHWDNGAPMDKNELISHALAGDLYPIKTSRHWTLRAMPPRATSLRRLRPETGVAR